MDIKSIVGLTVTAIIIISFITGCIVSPKFRERFIGYDEEG